MKLRLFYNIGLIMLHTKLYRSLSNSKEISTSAQHNSEIADTRIQFPLPTAQLSLSERREPYHISDDLSLGLEHFYIPAHYQDTLECLLVPHGTILDRVEKLAYDISQDYHGHTIHLLCVLKGGSMFFQDLCNALRKFHDYARNMYVPFTFDYIRVKSYEGTESTGSVKITGCDLSTLRGRHLIFVEDIIDTGLTMSRLLEFLHKEVSPASVRVASLVEKRTVRNTCGFKADYVGFSIPDKFVVGYCLDYNEVFRDLGHIGVINAHGIEKFSKYEESLSAAASSRTNTDLATHLT